MNKIDKYLVQIQEFEPVTMAAVGTALAAANFIMMASRTYKQHFTKNSRQCSGLPSKEKAICMVRAKVYAKNLELQLLKSSIPKCNKVKNADKCKVKVSLKIKQTDKQLKDTAARLKELKGKSYKY